AAAPASPCARSTAAGTRSTGCARTPRPRSRTTCVLSDGYRETARMRLADPAHNVELRRNAQGHDSVVFAFPYRADMVDAVRAIPGRRFDWQATEWRGPRVAAA